MSELWIYYDPDFRREPKVPDPSKNYCETCFRVVDTTKAVRVETYNDFPLGPEMVTMLKVAKANGTLAELPPFELTARKSESGKRFIGKDCWHRLVKEFGFVAAP